MGFIEKFIEDYEKIIDVKHLNVFIEKFENDIKFRDNNNVLGENLLYELNKHLEKRKAFFDKEKLPEMLKVNTIASVLTNIIRCISASNGNCTVLNAIDLFLAHFFYTPCSAGLAIACKPSIEAANNILRTPGLIVTKIENNKNIIALRFLGHSGKVRTIKCTFHFDKTAEDIYLFNDFKSKIVFLEKEKWCSLFQYLNKQPFNIIKQITKDEIGVYEDKDKKKINKEEFEEKFKVITLLQDILNEDNTYFCDERIFNEDDCQIQIEVPQNINKIPAQSAPFLNNETEDLGKFLYNIYMSPNFKNTEEQDERQEEAMADIYMRIKQLHQNLALLNNSDEEKQEINKLLSNKFTDILSIDNTDYKNLSFNDYRMLLFTLDSINNYLNPEQTSTSIPLKKLSINGKVFLSLNCICVLFFCICMSLGSLAVLLFFISPMLMITASSEKQQYIASLLLFFYFFMIMSILFLVFLCTTIGFCFIYKNPNFRNINVLTERSVLNGIFTLSKNKNISSLQNELKKLELSLRKMKTSSKKREEIIISVDFNNTIEEIQTTGNNMENSMMFDKNLFYNSINHEKISQEEEVEDDKDIFVEINLEAQDEGNINEKTALLPKKSHKK